MAKVIRKIVTEIPKEIDWILRVDGHTDKTKFLNGGKFTDNWELSQARALSVVKYFISEEFYQLKDLQLLDLVSFNLLIKVKTKKL